MREGRGMDIVRERERGVERERECGERVCGEREGKRGRVIVREREREARERQKGR